MKRKANARRFLAFLLSASMMISVCTPALAEAAEGSLPACAVTQGCPLPAGHEGSCPAPAAEEAPAGPDATLGPAPQADATPETAQASYTLYLTHYFRFTVGGVGRNVRAEQVLTLTEADFQDGVCDLARFAYDVPQLAVTEAKPLSQEAFDENNTGGARIVYAVGDGWEVVPAGTAEGTVLRDVFQGQLSDIGFVPADVVRVHMSYQYSSTGGLAGIDAAPSEILEILPDKQGDSYTFEIALPVREGFRIVLSPDELNQYVVNPPTGDETPEQLHQMLEDGSFSVDVDRYVIYAYQQKADDVHAEPDYTVLNDTYQNRYSDMYNEAWNRARIRTVEGAAGYTAAAVCGDETAAHPAGGEKHGANALVNPRLKVTLTAEQLQNAKENGLDIAVSYRRNATWYTVNHWVPRQLSNLTDEQIADKEAKGETRQQDGVTYVLLTAERLQGRVGGLTRAAAKTNDEVYSLLVPLKFSQKLIENEQLTNSATGTVVDIYYQAASSYRVIFDTDNTYIPRQQVLLGNKITFDGLAVPSRKGYLFAGWQYLIRDAEPDENGQYAPEQYREVPKDGNGRYELALTQEVVGQEVKLQLTDGVPVLFLYPIWKPDTTLVTVVLWTEDLTGADDVQAFAETGNTAYYDGKYRDYQDEPVTHRPVPQSGNTNYSNMVSFTVPVMTDSLLVAADDPAALTAEIQQKVEENFAGTAKETAGSDLSPFYTQDSFEILHEKDGAMDYATTTANADGGTTIYVYFTRNVYTLKFHYYGGARVNGVWSDYAMAYNTNGFSWGGAERILDENGELNFYYTASHQAPDGKWNSNSFMRPEPNDGGQMPVPQTVTIKAKYGADLREVWPSARTEESVPAVTLDSGASGHSAMISWATTQGKYRDDAVTQGSSHYDEPTIMGLYASMDAEVIADPANPDTVHHLVAYWSRYTNSYYRYNHCFEVPGVDVTAAGVEKIVLYGDGQDSRNVLYLVPTNTPAITRFGFTDLMEVAYDGSEVTYDVKDGGYYAVRSYTSGGETRYYAVGRRVEAPSTNSIAQQNPSARQHMTRANSNADHTTEHTDGQGMSWNNDPCGTRENPYDLYFYYNRDRYRIKYMAPSVSNNYVGSEVELGYIDLPYGAYVTEEVYAFRLNYLDSNQATDENGAPKYLWSYPKNTDGSLKDPVAVCPDRSPDGNAPWKFKGWGLGPKGVNMQWTMPDEYTPQAQTEADFYIGSDLLLYAIWEAPTLTVTFHLNGGVVSDKASIEVQVPANTVYTAVGTIPRPVRSGYTLKGWYKSDENGNATAEEFDFDAVIIEDQHVAAVWERNEAQAYGYTVYYLTPALRPEDEGKPLETVRLDDDGSRVDTGGTEYYVLAKDEHPDEVYRSDLVLNLTAKLQAGYIPRQTNQSLAVDPGESYEIFFVYDPQTNGQYTVRFIKAGTETDAAPQEIIEPLTVDADQVVVTPGAAAVQTLTVLGYELVNRGADNSYTAPDDYIQLTWLDADGNAQPMDTLRGDAIPAVVTYLAKPIDYTITYQAADGSPAEAADALRAVTAPEGTAPADASGKNPTQYTIQDAFTLKNPENVTAADGTVYLFTHWTLGVGTGTVPPQGAPSYTTLTVDAGTKGDLAFVAHWKKQPGALTVSKTVAGALGNRTKDFTFTVTLADETVTGIFGEMTFQNGVASFTLRHGQAKTADGLPADLAYTVTEQAEEGYTTTSTGAEGTIPSGGTATAAFTNERGGTPPTGLRDGASPAKAAAGLLLALAGACAGAVYGARRRRRRRP